MKLRNSLKSKGYFLSLLAFAPLSFAQVPVDDEGEVIGEYDTADDQPANTYSSADVGNEGIPLLSRGELEELVGPVALYPDDLLAVVLPASTFPLQVVQAGRFLHDLDQNPGLKPDPKWDDSVIALLNYPEVVELLNDDLDWTWRLGEAVVAQQGDVVNAVEAFRNRAYAAGNLKSDTHQQVSHDDGVIEISPVQEDIIYVPYYEPERVVVYQPRPVYHYYPRPCPVYYYPYSNSYAFDRGYFWGVTTAFTIGWRYDHLRVFHHSYHGHPYYGRSYRNRWWYRRPSINIYNTNYIRNSRNVAVNRRSHGDNWRPSRSTRVRYSNGRITRTRNYPATQLRTRNHDSHRGRERARSGGFVAPERWRESRRVQPTAPAISRNDRRNVRRVAPRSDRQVDRQIDRQIDRQTNRQSGNYRRNDRPRDRSNYNLSNNRKYSTEGHRPRVSPNRTTQRTVRQPNTRQSSNSSGNAKTQNVQSSKHSERRSGSNSNRRGTRQNRTRKR